MIDAFATLPHFVDHLAPIWHGLPDDLRGRFEVGPLAVSRARDRGIQPERLDHTDAGQTLTLVAAYNDERHVRPRPVVLVEHGAGQHYGGTREAATNPGYPGGRDREAVCLFLCPNEATARRWSAMYPATPCEVVGVPKLDAWHANGSMRHRLSDEPEGTLPLVVFSFHWDCPVVPECGSAFLHYRDELVRLARMSDEERGWRMGGHAHPKAHQVMQFWRAIGVQAFDHFNHVLMYADLYVADNTSTLYEFASTDRPVVVLNAPWYRRDVDHGGRFWTWATVGESVDEPGELVEVIESSLTDPGWVQERRREVVEQVYAYTDGHATDRAVAAVVREYEAGYWRLWRQKGRSHDPRGAPYLPARLDEARREIVQRMRDQGVTLTEAEADGLEKASPEDLVQLLRGLA